VSLFTVSELSSLCSPAFNLQGKWFVSLQFWREIWTLTNYIPIIHCLGDLEQEVSLSEHSQSQTDS
jgi:hypothetical protein